MDPSEVAGHAEDTKQRKSAKPLKSLVLNQVIENLGVTTRLNLFTGNLMFGMPGKPEHPITDLDECVIRDQMFTRDASVHPQVVTDRLHQLAEGNHYHPVQEYLEATEWDRVPRLDTWLTTYVGVRGSPYTRHAGTVMLRAAVRRVYVPGCKFDQALVLIGDEDSGKSLTIKTLCPHLEWFSESLPISASPKLVVEGTEGIWLIESPEMVAHKDPERVKDFLSRSVDGPVRKAYARNSDTVPRQFVVFGTTNNVRPIVDETGIRRFWPMKSGALEYDALIRDRDQLWAEAFLREMESGHEGPLNMPDHLTAGLTQEQRKFVVLDAWAEALKEWLSGNERPQDTPRILIEDIWAFLQVSKSQRTSSHQIKLMNAMKKLGYKRSDEPEYIPSRKRECLYFYSPNPFLPDNYSTNMTQSKADREEQEIIDSLDKADSQSDEPDEPEYDLDSNGTVISDDDVLDDDGVIVPKG